MKIALIRFQEKPWDIHILNYFNKALSTSKIFKEIDILHGYPNKNKFYDIIIIFGVRAIVKQNLDGPRIKKQCKFLCDVGEVGWDSRTNLEDMYFYFTPTKKPLFSHYKYLPKILDEDLLFPEHEINEPITIMIDHFKSTMNRIENVFNIVKRAPFPTRVFYQSSKGMEINPLKPDIPENKEQNYKLIPFNKIVKFYRKTHFFFPTHRESMGEVALEIAACGGLTVMEPWMYPEEVKKSFYHATYKENENINWEKLKEILNSNQMKLNRKMVLENRGFNVFKSRLIQHIKELIN